jgi:hypothetical protein
MGRAAVVLLLGASLATGCTSAAERAIERETGSDVEIQRDGDRVVIESEEGSLSVETGGELPEAIGDAFAVPADFSVDFVSDVTEGGNTFVSVSGHLERSDLESLREEITAAVTSAGWTVVMSYSMGAEMHLISASRGDQELQVSMSAVAGTTRFDVVITLLTNAG